MSVKPYFQPKDNYNIKPDELEIPVKLDELEAPTEPDKLKAPLFTVEVPQELTKPVKPIKRS